MKQTEAPILSLSGMSRSRSPTPTESDLERLPIPSPSLIIWQCMKKNNNTTIHPSCPFFILMTLSNTMLFNKALSSQVLLFRINSHPVSKIKSLCSLWFHNKVEFIFCCVLKTKRRQLHICKPDIFQIQVVCYAMSSRVAFGIYTVLSLSFYQNNFLISIDWLVSDDPLVGWLLS